ncbi:MAG: GNAT family N-acetyltransferase [Lachnospiraceae bacterium]|nr:GNAT family N-acetyltransferase [Lachnospiraceae bacterium]
MPKTIMIDKNFLPVFSDIIPAEFKFGKTGEFLLGALDDNGYACGILWYSFNDSGYDILFLGVHPAFRRQGIATRLLRELLDSVYKSNLIYPIRLSFEDTRDNLIFRRFLMNFGNFNIKFDSFTYIIDSKTRSESELLSGLEKKKVSTFEYLDVPPSARKRFETMLKNKGFYFIDDIADKDSNYIKEMCICTLGGTGINAAVFFKRLPENSIELSFAYGSRPDLTAILRTFSAALQRVKDTPYNECQLRIAAVNDSVKRFTEFVFGDEAYRIPVCVAEWNYNTV